VCSNSEPVDVEELHALSGPELLDRTRDLVEVINRAQAELARTVRVADSAQAFAGDGMGTAASWLRGHCRLSKSAASQVVRNGQPGNRVSVTIDSIAPRLFALRQLPAAPDGSPYGVALNSDGTLVLPSSLGVAAHPARRGDVITIYALGLGPVSPTVNTGDPSPSAEPLARLSNQLQVVYGSGGGAVSAVPSYAGLAPGFAGLYQINVLVPQNAPTGNVPVAINIPGHISNLVELAIAAQ